VSRNAFSAGIALFLGGILLADATGFHPVTSAIEGSIAVALLAAGVVLLFR
jgi:VIT1/CCC1 family predicted Fe2+/Mn2+ transporter